MTELIQRQLFQLVIMFYCGLALMLLFEGRDALVKRCGRRHRAAALVYFAGWICGGFLFYRFVYKASHGVITVYGLLAVAAGILLWKKIICGILKEKNGEKNEEKNKRETSGI